MASKKQRLLIAQNADKIKLIKQIEALEAEKQRLFRENITLSRDLNMYKQGFEKCQRETVELNYENQRLKERIRWWELGKLT